MHNIPDVKVRILIDRHQLCLFFYIYIQIFRLYPVFYELLHPQSRFTNKSKVLVCFPRIFLEQL